MSIIPTLDRSAEGRLFETEKSAIRNAQNGDPNAFQILYESYSQYVYSRCLRLTRDPAIAEDLSQDVFIQVWKKISTFRGQSKFKTWLHRVATNIVFMYLRKNQRQPALDEHNQHARDERKLEERFSSPASDLDDNLLLYQTISVLPPSHRAVLMLHDVDGYKHDEIARILGIPSGTSKSSLHRARYRIRTAFGRPPSRWLPGQQEAGSLVSVPKAAWPGECTLLA
jgi:RNA polymerase sigma-70 factor, ECF subfamily